jgi:hypothetical protein
MSKRHLQNEKLDQIGRKLFKTVSLSGDEIENIVASTQLFDSVLSRIKAEKQLSQKPEQHFVTSAIEAFFYRPKALVAFAFLTFLVIGAALSSLKNPVIPELVEQITRPEVEQKIPLNETLVATSKIKKVKVPAEKTHPVNEKTAFKTGKSKLVNLPRKQTSTKPLPAPKKQQPEVFYSLSFPGNWEADGEILQIVRTEVSRSELFALGVNLPVENESAKVKTDLLVGGDGVARAIRIVE